MLLCSKMANSRVNLPIITSHSPPILCQKLKKPTKQKKLIFSQRFARLFLSKCPPTSEGNPRQVNRQHTLKSENTIFHIKAQTRLLQETNILLRTNSSIRKHFSTKEMVINSILIVKSCYNLNGTFPSLQWQWNFVLNIIEVNGPLGLWTFWLYGLCCKGVLL